MPQNTPPILTSIQANAILNGKTEISLDLGLTKTKIKPTKEGYNLTEGEFIDTESLEKIAETEGTAYFVDKKSVYMAATSGKHFYKLVPTAGAPTLEIDGIRMHRTKNTTPDRDTHTKLTKLGLNDGNVLDTCMGLGYTAIHAMERNATNVITIEFQPNVLRICAVNPWSRKLFTSKNIHKLIGDSFHVADALPKDYFDYIIHDPPRRSSAGHLYGQEFYNKLARLIKSGGKMYHYTGEPRSKYRKVDTHTGIKRRLGKAGFKNIEYHSVVMGFTCTRTA